jgi:hypothetical protein
LETAAELGDGDPDEYCGKADRACVTSVREIAMEVLLKRARTNIRQQAPWLTEKAGKACPK